MSKREQPPWSQGTAIRAFCIAAAVGRRLCALVILVAIYLYVPRGMSAFGFSEGPFPSSTPLLIAVLAAAQFLLLTVMLIVTESRKADAFAAMCVLQSLGFWLLTAIVALSPTEELAAKYLATGGLLSTAAVFAWMGWRVGSLHEALLDTGAMPR